MNVEVQWIQYKQRVFTFYVESFGEKSTYMLYSSFFLAHLGQRLKLAFLIKICPLSVVVVGVVAFHIFILSRTTWPISTKLGTMHPWVRGIQFCSNEGPRTFPRGDNFKWKHVKFIAYSRTSIYSNIDYQEMSMKLLRWTRWNQYRSKDWPYDSYYWKPLLVVLFRTVQAIQLKVCTTTFRQTKYNSLSLNFGSKVWNMLMERAAY